MTPTEQDKLIETILSVLGIVDTTSGNRPGQIATLKQELTAYITADRKRVALEARIDELEKFVNTTNRSLSVKKLRDRLSALKSQQEEV